MIKASIRNAIATVADRTGLIARSEARIGNDLTILCYHRVLPPAQRGAYHDPDLAVTPDTFRAHCKLLARHYTVAPLVTALERLQSGVNTGRPFAAITFDDGYQDNFVLAAPILREHGLRATFFVVAGLVDTESLPWYDVAGASWNALASLGRRPPGANARDALERAKHLPPVERQAWLADLQRQAGALSLPETDRIMTSAQLTELSAEGHEIGSHTMTHPLLPQCDDADLEDELRRSRTILAHITRQAVLGICFPNGDSDGRVLAASSEAGYGYATSLEQGINRRRSLQSMALKRWFISQDRLSNGRGQPSEALFRMEISGLAQRIFKRGLSQ